MIRRIMVLSSVLALGFLAQACDDGEEEPTAVDGGGSVDITLEEFAIGASPATAGAGEVEFNVTNDGPNDPHEFVVIKTDLGITELPTVEDGSVDEEGEGIELIGEVEEIEVGASESATYELDAGAYVFICNIVEDEDGELESHYQEGMRTAFTVT